MLHADILVFTTRLEINLSLQVVERIFGAWCVACCRDWNVQLAYGKVCFIAYV
jgi:hypothetical protein